MRKSKKIISLLLAVVLVLSCFTVVAAVNASAVTGFTVTAVSNFFPERSETFKPDADHITVSYYIQSDQMMVNSQWNLYFDPAVLKYCEDEGVNQTSEFYEEEFLGYDYNIAPVTDSYGAVINTEKVSKGEIHGNNSNPNPVYKLKTDENKKIGFITVTFEVLDPTKDTSVNLEVVEMLTNKGQIYRYSAPVSDDSLNGFELQSSVYEGNYDPDYENQEPATEEPTTEPVTEPATEEPTTEEPTTEEPTTEEPTTEEPATEEPTTEEPTTEEPTTEPATEEPTTEPAPADVYSVAGSSAAIFGAEWDGDNTATEMTFNDATGLYEITFENVQPANAIQLKVLQNHNWDTSYGDAKTGDNYTFNVTEACDVTVTIDPETKIVNVTGDGVTQDTELDVQRVIAVGNGEDTYLNGVNWDPTDVSNEMTKVADGIYEFTMTDIYAFDNYQIKFAINSVDENDEPSSNPWAHNFGLTRGETYVTGETFDAAYNGENIIFEVEEDGSTVKVQLDLRDFDFVTKQGAKFTITVEEEVVEPTTEPATEEPTTEPATEEPTTEPATEEPTTEPQPAGLIGDINGDGSIDVLDSTMIKKYVVEKITLTDAQIYVADVNGDNSVDVLDATLIEKYVVEKITEFPKKA